MLINLFLEMLELSEKLPQGLGTFSDGLAAQLWPHHLAKFYTGQLHSIYPLCFSTFLSVLQGDPLNKDNIVDTISTKIHIYPAYCKLKFQKNNKTKQIQVRTLSAFDITVCRSNLLLISASSDLYLHVSAAWCAEASSCAVSWCFSLSISFM